MIGEVTTLCKTCMTHTFPREDKSNNEIILSVSLFLDSNDLLLSFHRSWICRRLQWQSVSNCTPRLYPRLSAVPRIGSMHPQRSQSDRSQGSPDQHSQSDQLQPTADQRSQLDWSQESPDHYSQSDRLQASPDQSRIQLSPIRVCNIHHHTRCGRVQGKNFHMWAITDCALT